MAYRKSKKLNKTPFLDPRNYTLIPEEDLGPITDGSNTPATNNTTRSTTGTPTIAHPGTQPTAVECRDVRLEPALAADRTDKPADAITVNIPAIDKTTTPAHDTSDSADDAAVGESADAVDTSAADAAGTGAAVGESADAMDASVVEEADTPAVGEGSTPAGVQASDVIDAEPIFGPNLPATCRAD
ncbi:hypothetical protein C1Y63_03855, partial [Corynebacterium sp. 13CS0277]|uniref:hypothetical protein n=1 Tax=Corynebacterium sp. 13CS0277 TaxID=2071994 RepID=UPI000D4E00D2